MNYDIITLSEKKVVGVTARTNNQSPEMPVIIGGLWQKLFGEVFAQISHRSNDKTIGLYSDYESDMLGDYNITAGCEVTMTGKIPEDCVMKVIPAGRYARFIVKGHMQTAVAQFWSKLWEMDLDRNYQGDFEEYQDGSTLDDAEIHIYIGLKA